MLRIPLEVSKNAIADYQTQIFWANPKEGLTVCCVQALIYRGEQT